jgi:hypothetical protein
MKEIKMPPFAFLSSKQFEGCEFIVELWEPCEVFRPFKFPNNEALEDFMKKYNLLNECVVVAGYNILICYVGNILKFSSVPVLGHNVPRSTKSTFEDLKKFYEKERINGNETRNKKFARY